MKIQPVVLAGGSGSRLWPLSRASMPKQFLTFGDNTTMFQKTLDRLKGESTEIPITVCSEEFRFLVAGQLQKEDMLGPIILEPEGRSTAPAIALAAFLADDDPVLLIVSADHEISDNSAFKEAIFKAANLAETGGLVTIGVPAREPHTGYGYIRLGDIEGEGYKVREFVEKPSKERARSYVDSGQYCWNSGIFVFKASAYLRELNRFEPEIHAICRQVIAEHRKDLDFIRLSSEVFLRCRSISVDYAVMENTEDAYVVPMEGLWSDVGSWSSIWDARQKDQVGNVTVGDVIPIDSKNCYLHSEDKLLASIGLEDLIVVVTKDACLVANRERSEDVKSIISHLQAENRLEWKTNKEVFRPWGKYESLDSGSRFQVKRITVRPGQKLSLQMHKHRAEHWVVVVGQARVTRDGEIFDLCENESTYIPVGAVHSLENVGSMNLELIEVQSGGYLGEDDIVRFEDRYNRV